MICKIENLTTFHKTGKTISAFKESYHVQCKTRAHGLVYICIAIFSLQSCTTRVYHNKAFLAQPNLQVKTLAVLPVNMVFTGVMPRDLSEEQQKKWEDAESNMVQNMIMLAYRTHKPRQAKAKVSLLPIENTNYLLAEHGITQRQGWEINPQAIGNYLQADWLLKVTVKKDRMMSRYAAIGVDVASNVMDNLLYNGNTVMQGNGMASTDIIYLEAQLVDTLTGTVISTFVTQNNATWSNPPQRILQRSAKQIVRRGVITGSTLETNLP